MTRSTRWVFTGYDHGDNDNDLTGEYIDAVLAKFLHHRMAMYKSASKGK